MKKVAMITMSILMLSTIGNAQKKKDQEAIKSMCGCYEVGFNFAETFEYSNDTAYVASKVKQENALEWVQLVEDDKDKISLQHLLIVGSPKRQFVVKHWRQDWLYQNRDLYEYDKGLVWKYSNISKKQAKGTWTQKVFQVDDSPRYEGFATWVHVDGKSYWENTATAPLPRREYTQRNDYNVTLRRNRQEITKNGWIHNQDNDKLIRKDGQPDVLLAQEKGLNTYVKVDDSKCKAAQDWWTKNKNTWALVRAKWEQVYGRNQDLKLKEEVDGKPLYKYLFADDFSGKEAEIDSLIDSYIVE
ncbi:hypothetical protein QVZ41_08560 [Wenyingzhuangia sp. chi5]|uniref:YARHG domain-containing protein n=1 Tax=Wenyingzhuangia gilva TaxID=3057677 RepID=A0ABT8VSD6_9FLAO|nr:DUF6607 family protein [Wenyingzhuangia sp. chi5]MDO3694894.1 hypothetical protein [Wenyingzhuangia sp. chi5]